MLYKEIDTAKLCLEFACPYCLSAKFAESATLYTHVRSCQGATILLTADELADTANLQIGDGLIMSDYITDEEAYYTYMFKFASANILASHSNSDPDELLEFIVKELADAQTKNKEMLGWRLMATFFTLDDDVMERYLQLIYGVDDSEDEERQVHPMPEVSALERVDVPAQTNIIINKLA